MQFLTKSNYRKKLLADKRACTDYDTRILSKLLSRDEFINSEIVLTYVSMENEIDTHVLIKHCLEVSKCVAVPRVIGDHIHFYIINSFDDLKQGYFNVLEPISGCKKLLHENFKNSVCIVPTLACNTSGFRIGYGKGFYDRFLKNYDGISIALCYEQFVIDFPVDEHDISVNLILTEV